MEMFVQHMNADYSFESLLHSSANTYALASSDIDVDGSA